MTERSTTYLDTLRVHLVVFLRLSPVETGITLLTDQQVRKVYFLEFKLDGFDELLRDEVGCLAACSKMSEQAGDIVGRVSPRAMTVGRSVGPNFTMTESVSP